jgi:tRNA pseudouridine38-40 synthase
MDACDGAEQFSGKLLIDEEKDMDRHTGRVRGLTERLNEALPPTIRVFSCTRVNKRFAARRNCVLREYEYFLPLSFLQTSVLVQDGADAPPLDVDEAVGKFMAALREYEGIHDFHNFTKSRSFFYKAHAKMEHLKRATRVDDDVDEEQEDADGIDEEEDNNQEDEQGDEYRASTSQFGDASETVRNLLPRHRRAIYSCSGSVIHDFMGEPFLRVHIVGQAFLFNQIRCMVGGALAVGTNGLSMTAFRAALGKSTTLMLG